MKSIVTILLATVIFLFSVNSSAQEKIKFDGYWWGTANKVQKLGYVQGFIDGFGIAKLIMAELVSSPNISESDAKKLKMKIFFWNPFDHNFGYYIDRIDSYYRTTGTMQKLVNEVMVDLITPLE